MKHGLIDEQPIPTQLDECIERVAPTAQACLDESFREACRLALSVYGQGDEARPYSLEVALMLKQLGVDQEVLTATLLSEPRLREQLEERWVKTTFGAKIAQLVRDVNRLNLFTEYAPSSLDSPEQVERLRRMLIAMVDDVRVVVIKLAYRVQRLRLLDKADDETRCAIARESLDLFAPIANRLGLGQLKWEIEDLAFRFLDPAAYKKIARLLEERRKDRETYIKKVMQQLRDHLKESSIEAEVSGRPKHIYSIWRKMQRKHLDFEQLFDLRAVRILLPDVPSCYAALGLVHHLWHHIPKEFDDYIANPKENGYQSLHTAVFGPESKVIEIQIRTREMHLNAEQGVASHWRYKEGRQLDKSLERSIADLRTLLEGSEGEMEDLSSLSATLNNDHVYVLTPKGEVIELSDQATPLDFAYTIHTEVGHRCRGAKVNGRIVPLSYTLQTGDQVEILTARRSEPRRDWLSPHVGYLKTPRARSKVRAWFNRQEQEANEERALGASLFERLLNRHRGKRSDPERLAKRLKLKGKGELFTALARGSVSEQKLLELLTKEPSKGRPDGAGSTPPTASAPPSPRPSSSESSSEAMSIAGEGNLLTQLAKCCNPVAGDRVIGYITQGHGVTIHRRDCVNVTQLPPERQSRLVEVDWGGESGASYPVELRIVAYDRTGLLRDITVALADVGINLLAVNTLTDKHDNTALMDLTLETRDRAQLERALERVGALRNVLEVIRLGERSAAGR